MAISVNWITGVISIPKNDMTLLQSSPTEIRELDTNAFRLVLRDLEDDVDGRPWPRTHDHNEDVLVGGVTLADVLIMLDPYTITFEDLQYAVYLTGTNNNILEKTNKNQVSVNPGNSAGLISTPLIEYASFQNAVCIDIITGVSGTLFPTGTRLRPVDNVADALIIAAYRGLSTLFIMSGMTIDSGSDLSDFKIVGDSHVHTDIIIDPSADVTGVHIIDCNLSGTLDGDADIARCTIGTLTYVYGHIHDSTLAGVITLAGNEDAWFGNCGSLSVSIVPEVNMGGTGQNLVMADYAGIVKLTNSTNIVNKVGIGLDAGVIILDTATFTHGFIHVSGIGRLTDELDNDILSGTWNTNVTVINTLVNTENIVNAVWDEPLTGNNHNNPTSAGRRLRDISTSVIHTGTAVSATVNTIELNGDASGVDGAYDPSLIAIVGGTGFGQTRLVLEYKGSTKTAVVDRNWKTTPDATSEYSIVAHPGREHVNEGLAQGGTANTITLNVLASSIDDAYNGQVVFIRSGVGEDQALRVIDYNGTTKVATVCDNWGIVPDGTSGYVMLSGSVLKSDKIADAIWSKVIDSPDTAQDVLNEARDKAKLAANKLI